MRYLIAVLALATACCSRSALDYDVRGRDCLATHDLGCAVDAFSHAVREAPSDARYRYNLALSLAKIGALEQARHELEVALELDPTHMHARRLLQRVHRAIASANSRMVLLD